MKVLIDTNIALTYITGRETDPDKDSVSRFMALYMKEEIDGYLAFHSVSNMWFIMTHLKDKATGTPAFTKSEVRESLKDFCRIVTVVGADTDAVIDALNSEDFKDFEDCLQEKCAIAANADYIITNNIKDFTDSAIPAVTPGDFLKKVSWK